MNELRKEIGGYYDSVGLERTDRILKLYPMDAIQATMAAILLDSPDQEEVSNTLLFIRDASLLGEADLRARFWDALCVTGFLSVLAVRLNDPSLGIRDNAVYTIGKISLPGSGALLLDALKRSRDTEPLLLNRLVSEAAWTHAAAHDDLWDSVAESPCYLSRWSALEDSEIPADRMERLLADESPYIRTEAAFRQEEITLRKELADATRGVRNRALRAHREREPLTFSTMRNCFAHYQHERQATDYTVEELEEFVRALSASTALSISLGRFRGACPASCVVNPLQSCEPPALL
jgi:hypothetical protein